jgi:hypothetical protein
MQIKKEFGIWWHMGHGKRGRRQSKPTAKYIVYDMDGHPRRVFDTLQAAKEYCNLLGIPYIYAR